MYYNNKFYVDYVKNYDTQTSKTRLISAKTLRNVLYFDINRWDYSYFPQKDINVLKKLPTAFFKTLQITFFTREKGNDF